MCTVSVIKSVGEVRICMNRDERHDRPIEQPPRLLNPSNNVIGPLDPAGGGTWIAYNKHGYWGCLLNGYFENSKEKQLDENYLSRGHILPYLLGQVDPWAAVNDLSFCRYQSFRLIIGRGGLYKLCQWDGSKFAPAQWHFNDKNKAFLLTSSSWQQDEVIQQRKQQFKQWLSRGASFANGIPIFHLSSQPNVSSAPLMMRSSAGTKSITTMVINNGGHDIHSAKPKNIVMRYHPFAQLINFGTAENNNQLRALG